MDSYETRLHHNYGELTVLERARYNWADRKEMSLSDRFFYEACIPIPGELYKAERKALYDAIIQYQPTYCFEIGTGSGGGSTFFLACAFAKLGRGKVITLEIHDNVALHHYRRFLPGLLPFVGFLKGSDPFLFMPFIEDNGGIVECVFLDGSDNSEEAVGQYEFFKPLFKPGSILMAHDWNGVKMKLLKPIIETNSQWSIEVLLNAPESLGFIVARYNEVTT